MANRQEIHKRREALKAALRTACKGRTQQPGVPTPPVRELSVKFKLSGNVVCQVLQELIAEGVLYTVPRVGTFAGSPRPENGGFFLMLLPDRLRLTEPQHLLQIQTGFESRVAELGGASLVMPLHRALELQNQAALPTLSGLFDFAFHPDDPRCWGPTGDLPRVGMLGRIEDPTSSDAIAYDDADGGYQAARHLIFSGHRRVAFLALHAEHAPGQVVWSQERELGWRRAMSESSIDVTGLAFHPIETPDGHYSQQIRVARGLGAAALRCSDLTAIVTANDFAAMGLLQAAKDLNLPPDRWPSIVGFDNLPLENGHILSSMRLPSDQLGRAAADALHERRRIGPGAPVIRRVAMNLIARLTSRPEWSKLAGSLVLESAASV